MIDYVTSLINLSSALISLVTAIILLKLSDK